VAPIVYLSFLLADTSSVSLSSIAVKEAIAAGADLKQKESTVFLPLELAINLSTAPVVEELLAAGCSPSDRSFSGVMLADSALVKLDDPYVTETEKDRLKTLIPLLYAKSLTCCDSLFGVTFANGSEFPSQYQVHKEHAWAPLCLLKLLPCRQMCCEPVCCQGTLDAPHPLAVRMRYPPMKDGESSAALTALGVQHMTRDK